MSDPTKDKNQDTKDTFQKSNHTYTPNSHEELLKKYAKATNKSKDLEYLKRENEKLNRELNTSSKLLEKLHQRIKILEEKNGLKTGVHSFTQTLFNTEHENQFEVEVDSDDDYSRSWALLGEHFNEVIRRHHEVLAEKDRLIRYLQERNCNGESSKKRFSTPTREDASQTGCSLDEASSNGLTERDCCTPKNNESEKRDINNGDSSSSCHCADECNFTNRHVSLKDSVISSGVILSEHFSEVIRRHKQELQEKDMQIQELQEALACCIGGKTIRQTVGSEVQMWNHDYYESQPCVESTPPTVTRATVHTRRKRTSLEEDDSPGASTDTFVALEKCQRLESIANLERLRQYLMERLQLEEKLDKLYWQTELKRYQELREEAGDHFDPSCTFNKDFEQLEITRLELLRALKEVKESGRREPEIYVKPHTIVRDSECSVDEPTFSACEDKRRVKFTDRAQIYTVTDVQTTSDTDNT